MALRDQYRTKCGGVLVLPPKTKEHLVAHSVVSDLLEEVAGLLELLRDGSFVAREVELSRVVGRSGCVSATAVGLEGEANFALRVGRRKASRVAIGVEGPEASTVVVLACADKAVKGTYVLITAYVGALAPKEPWDAAPGPEREASLAFWGSHALVWDPEVMGEPVTANWSAIING